MDNIGLEEEEIAAIDYELSQIESKLEKLKDQKTILISRKNKLKDQILKRKSENLASRNWSLKNFPWSAQVDSVLKKTFKISEFRPLQLEAINATLSKEDTILIMPTGGGKSLCYQLPALIDNGITLVVSPLVSLMEDQIMGLKKINYPALMLSANSSKEETAEAMAALKEPSSKIKLIYVTPEKLHKSKRFMSMLQKCGEQGRFARLAIDEVHCCSVWGHDFRPDYNYLGPLRGMFPDTPVLGLTATSTSKVTADVQKMLGIQGCLVLKSSFNRPNLYYEVMIKPPSQNECLDLLEDWLNNRFKNQTGIIYTTTIKDCDELAKELKKRGLRAGVYHAMLDAEVRSKMHSKWMSGELQVVVATIAFGLGIDKPDVRFVIHHTLSKSMESYYQESGRAGRDNKLSHCIIMFRLADVFKISSMVFTTNTGTENLYGMLNYCLDSHRCRRGLIADYFDEVWDSNLCSEMCDHCKNPREVREYDATLHTRTLYNIIQQASEIDVKLTAIKLIDAWYCKGDSKLRLKDVKAPSFDRVTAERIIGYLLVLGYLKEDNHFTAYSTISYLKRGPRSSLLEDRNHRIILKFPGVPSPKKNGNLTVPVEAESSSPSTSPADGKLKRNGSGRKSSTKISPKISPKVSKRNSMPNKVSAETEVKEFDLKRKSESDEGDADISEIKYSKFTPMSQEY